MKKDNIKKFSKIKLVHVIPTLSRGGAERLVVDICNKLDRRFFECSIIIFSHNMPLADELHKDVMLHVVNKTKKFDIGFNRELKKLLKAIKPDVVHTHLSGADVWASRAAKKLSIPVVSTEHSLNSNETKIHNYLKTKSIKYIDYHIAISQAVANDMSLRYNIKQDKISVIYNGVNTKRFKEINLVKKLSSKLKVAVIGRLEKEKGHEQLINSLLELDRGSYHVTIVGEGSLRRDLQALVISYGLSKYIKFIGHHDNISSIYKRNEVIIVPSISEGFGLVAVEAMAAGRVVIAADVDGLPEIIEHNKNGFLVNFENNIALKKQIKQLYKKPDNIYKITKKARQDAIKYYDISIMIKHYEKIYRQLA